MLPARRALLSVSDKTGLADFARGLAALGFELLSTGGTRGTSRAAGLAVTESPRSPASPRSSTAASRRSTRAIHGGILADRAQAARTCGARRARHRADRPGGGQPLPVREHGRAARRSPSRRPSSMIDIGGPAMVRAAAKNYASVAVVVDPADYPAVLAALAAAAAAPLPSAAAAGWRAKAFAPHRRLRRRDRRLARRRDGRRRRRRRAIPAAARRSRSSASSEPRYGENPHQAAAVYRLRGRPRPARRHAPAPGQGALVEQPARRRRRAQARGALRRAGGGHRQAQQPLRRRPRRRPRRGLRARPRLRPGLRLRLDRRGQPPGRPTRCVDGHRRALRRGPGRARSADRRRSRGLAPKKNLRLLACPPYAPRRAATIELRGHRRRLPRAGARRLRPRIPRSLDLPDARASPTAEERRGARLRLGGGALRQVERHRARQRRPDAWASAPAR